MSYSVAYQDIGVRDYKNTWDLQEEIFKKLVDKKLNNQLGISAVENNEPGTLIIVEHPHVFTLGKNGSERNLLIDSDLLRSKQAKYYKTNRGGDITYHGPGQIVGYPIFDLELMKIGLKEYIFRLEEAIILTLSYYGLSGSRLSGATGVWLNPDNSVRARKICAIGVRTSRFITMHGFAFNVNTDLSYFDYINPCGFQDKGVTSLEKELGFKPEFEDTKLLIKNSLQKTFDLRWVN